MSYAPGTRVHSTFPFGYGGKQLDRGEITKLVGGKNDEFLVDNKYFGLVPASVAVRRCDKCSREFIDEPSYHDHKKKSDCFDEQEVSRIESQRILEEAAGITKNEIDEGPIHVNERSGALISTEI